MNSEWSRPFLLKLSWKKIQPRIVKQYKITFVKFSMDDILVVPILGLLFVGFSMFISIES